MAERLLDIGADYGPAEFVMPDRIIGVPRGKVFEFGNALLDFAISGESISALPACDLVVRRKFKVAIPGRDGVTQRS